MGSLAGLHDYADLVAKHSMDKHGLCHNLWAILREGDARLVHTPWSDETEKRFQVDWLRETFFMDQSIERYAFVGEVFLFDQHDASSDTFHRKVDGLVVQSQERNGKGLLRTYEVVGLGTKQKRLTLTVDDEFNGAEGLLATLFDLPDHAHFGMN